MINYINNTDKAYQVFITQVRENDNAVFAPKYVHTSTFTIEQYLGFGKLNFDIQLLVPLLERLGVTDINEYISRIPKEQRLLIHYLAHLTEQADSVYLEIPEDDYSDYFVTSLLGILCTYDDEMREVTIITSNQEIISRVSYHQATCDHKYNNQTFKLKITRRDIIGSFIGGKYLVMTSLIIGLLIIAVAISIDTKFQESYSGFFSMPRNIVAVHNKSTTCDFNKLNYSVEDCYQSSLITYNQLHQLLSREEIQTIWFDDMYKVEQVNQSLSTGQQVEVSIPNIGVDFGDKLNNIPCTNPQTPIEGITCVQYTDETSLLGKAEINDDMSLINNIVHDPNSNPEYIFIKTKDAELTASYLASRYPSINIMTNRSVERYIQHSNRHLIISVILYGTLISGVLGLSLFYFLYYFGLSLRGLKYFYGFKTKRPYMTNKIYFLTQIGYFGLIIIIGTFITTKVTGSMTSFYIGVYFGILNSLIWVYLAIYMGGKFKEEERKLFAEIKHYEKQKKQGL